MVNWFGVILIFWKKKVKKSIKRTNYSNIQYIIIDYKHFACLLTISKIAFYYKYFCSHYIFFSFAQINWNGFIESDSNKRNNIFIKKNVFFLFFVEFISIENRLQTIITYFSFNLLFDSCDQSSLSMNKIHFMYLIMLT